MTSPYLTKPLRTLEQAIAEKLRRPVAVGGRRPAMTAPASDDAEAVARPRMVVVNGAAEAGDD